MPQPTAATSAPAVAALRPAWIRSAGWDIYWIFSGLWAPALAVLVYLSMHGVSAGLPTHAPAFHTQHFVLLFTALGVLHRLSSIHAVVLSPILRTELRANPRRYVIVPLLIVVVTWLLSLAFTFHPAFAALGTARGQLWAFYVLAPVLLVWDRWHFCAQEFGVLSIYRARAGQSARSDRRFDRWYVVVLMLIINSLLYVRAGFGDDLQVLWRGTGLPELYGGPFIEWCARVACGAALGLTSFAMLREWRHERRSWPKLGYYMLIGSHSLVLYLWPNAFSLFFLSYVFHHWMVAVGLFNRVTLNSYAPASRWRRAGRYLVRVGPWFGLCVLLSVFLRPLDLTARLTPLPTTDVFAGAGTLARLGAGLVIGAFFAFSFLHYYYDRCLYSFSVEGVRRAVGPLLFQQGPARSDRTDG